jgi:chemotaxis protein histidine kinase CheA
MSTDEPNYPEQVDNLSEENHSQAASEETQSDSSEELKAEIEQLKAQKTQLETEIQTLEAQKQQRIAEETAETKAAIAEMVQQGLQELEEKRQNLQQSVEQLERRRDRVQEEMRTTFAGVSQELAIRLQGFKDYLVGSLQDLAVAAEQLDLPSLEEPVTEQNPLPSEPPAEKTTASPKFAQKEWEEESRQISDLLDQYRTFPNYYGPPWQLRRTFEPIHADRAQEWFFTLAGRGAIPTMGSRLQNILVASAIISVLRELYQEQLRILVLADSPERLGEWRRGLQDCLGISRSDFGPTRGVILFESPESLVQRAERILEDEDLPLIIIDQSENEVDLSLLQFPLWLAFAKDFQESQGYSF